MPHSSAHLLLLILPAKKAGARIDGQHSAGTDFWDMLAC